MATPFLSEIRIMSFNFAPKGWAMCNGQFLPINQNQALFALLGTMYGGNGQTTFALPDLRGKVPLHIGSGFVQGQSAGQYAHTVIISEMPQHVHPMNAVRADADKNAGGTIPGTNKALAQGLSPKQPSGTNPVNIYGTGTPNLVFNPVSITNVGGSQPHENTQPYLTLNFCICLSGAFPSQN